MTKRIYLLLAVVSVFCACKDNNDPYSGGSSVTPSVSFDYTRRTPLMFEFTNTSTGCVSYRWDFGDGTFATGTDAMKSFDAVGTYKVTLTGTASNGKKYYYSENIAVTKPTMYVAGYTLYRIPYENRYYKLVVKDDALLPSSWDWYTNYTPMLDNSDIPYTYTFNNPKVFENPESHTYYTVQVIRTNNTSSTSNDVSCMKQKLYVKELMQYKQEYILETDATAVGIKIGYAY